MTEAYVMGGPGNGPMGLTWCTVTAIARQDEPMTIWSTSEHAAEGATLAHLTRVLGLDLANVRWGYPPAHPLARPLFQG